MKLTLTLVAFLLAGCGTPSLHGLHTPETTVFDESLVGEWQDGDGTSRVTIEAGDGRSYAITCAHIKEEPPTIIHITGWLVEIGAARYADLELAGESRDELGKRFGMFALPVHLLMRLEVAEDTMTLRLLDQDWLREGLAADGAVAHALIGEQVVFTAPAEEVQAFLRGHGDDRGAYMDDRMTLRRSTEQP